MKLDGTGVPEWSKTFGTDIIESIYAMYQTPDGGYVLAGETYTKADPFHRWPSRRNPVAVLHLQQELWSGAQHTLMLS